MNAIAMLTSGSVLESTEAIFVPDATPIPAALTRTTHLGIGAHSDDLEFMAYHGICQCYRSKEKWFGGITCTNGAGSARAGIYGDLEENTLIRLREREQVAAAQLGDYAFVAQLGHGSQAIKTTQGAGLLTEQLAELISCAAPDVIYTHNPFDRHPTHIAVLKAVMAALENIPITARPKRLLGCEMWRGLDWLPDTERILLDVSGHEKLAQLLNGTFLTQISGGKRYDLAVMGRRKANATFDDSHSIDATKEAIYAVDLTALIGSSPSQLSDFVDQKLRAFEHSIKSLL